MQLLTKLILLIIFCLCVFCAPAFAQGSAAQGTIQLGDSFDDQGESEEAEESERSVLTHVLLYLPNRMLDLFDIVRARVRIGPGGGLGIRVTKVLQLNFASYATVFVGLPGPRRGQAVKLPAGLEVYSGLELSVLELEAEVSGPDYSPTEIGVGGQFLLVGADVGVDPLEILDFIAGLFFIDFQDDDL